LIKENHGITINIKYMKVNLEIILEIKKIYYEKTLTFVKKDKIIEN